VNTQKAKQFCFVGINFALIVFGNGRKLQQLALAAEKTLIK